MKSDRVTELEEELDIIKGELSAALDSAKKRILQCIRIFYFVGSYMYICSSNIMCIVYTGTCIVKYIFIS